MKTKIDTIFASYKEDLESLISIPSILEESEAFPFGEAIQRALEKTLLIAKKLGFETYIDPNGYYGYAEIGEGSTLFGVLGHIDVVPVGDKNNWTHDPFTLVESEGYLFGRGTSDDKGPLLASMYALKAVLDSGYKLNKRVRFIIGTDEESFWRCMAAYKENEEMPDMGFTPDASFPLIYAEKGLVQYQLFSHELTDVNMHGGIAFNAVPDCAVIDYDEAVLAALKALDRQYKVKENKIEVYGKSIHAMLADEGENAIVYAAEALDKAGLGNKMTQFIVEKLANANGENIFGVVEDDVTGKLTMNVAMVEIKENVQTLSLDFRVPISYELEKIDEKLKQSAHQYQIVVEKYDELPSVYLERDSELIEGLMAAYQEISGDYKSQAMTSGGATYARSMENIVAFGALFPDDIATEHQVDERISIETLKKAMAVYAQAYINLVVEEKK